MCFVVSAISPSPCIFKLCGTTDPYYAWNSNKVKRYVHSTVVIPERYRGRILAIYLQNTATTSEVPVNRTQDSQFQKKRRGEGVIELLELFGNGAVVTPLGMNTQCLAAFRAPVFLSLAIEELLHSMILYVIQIINHAHVVFCSITIIEFLEVHAGKLIAVRAELDFIS